MYKKPLKEKKQRKRLIIKYNKMKNKSKNNWDFLRIHFRVYLKKHKSATIIQSCYSGYYLRKEFLMLNDNYTIKLLNTCLDKYIRDLDFTKKINLHVSKKKRRNENFPSDISENIVKFAIAKKYGVMPCWDTDKGDLIIKKKNIFIQIEVKGFTSNGPTSFGPTENWDRIYFVDGMNIRNKIFKVYEIPLSNTCEIWRSIRISGTEFDVGEIHDLPDNIETLKKKELEILCKDRGLTTSGNKNDLIERIKTQTPGSKFKQPKTYGEICAQKRRGELRSGFYQTFKPQLEKYCKLIFDGHISELNNTL